jgi:hypothetical protein
LSKVLENEETGCALLDFDFILNLLSLTFLLSIDEIVSLLFYRGSLCKEDVLLSLIRNDFDDELL